MPSTDNQVDIFKRKIDQVLEKINALNSAEIALMVATRHELENVVLSVRADLGSVDWESFKNRLADGISDAFHEARKEMKIGYGKLSDMLYSLQASQDRAAQDKNVP